jgi:hypothetical protein
MMILIVSSHMILAMVLMRPLVAVSMPCMALIMAMVVHMIVTVLAVSVTGVVVFWELDQVLIGIMLLFIVQLNKQFFDTYIPKDHLRMTDHIFWICVV